MKRYLLFICSLCVVLTSCSLSDMRRVDVTGVNMEPTIEQGSSIIVSENKKDIERIKRFDIVVYSAPDANKNYVGRVIGLPGEDIVYEGDQLLVDGERIAEPFLEESIAQATGTNPFTWNFTSKEALSAQTIPDGTYFIMGDNRPMSKDSRMIGAIAQEHIIGVKSVEE
mgnify:CR=1 FL=1